MRAIYYKNLKDLSSNCEVIDEKFHHLVNVLRIKKNDEVLFLDGEGGSRRSIVTEILKKKIICEFSEEFDFSPLNSKFKVALGKTKREALELSLKQLVEIGISEIFVVESEYSQRYPLKVDRINKLLESALEQSNALYLPKVIELKFNDFRELNWNQLIYFSSTMSSQKEIKLNETSNLILIGPEGGFSPKEELELSNLSKTTIINLKTNIMRAPTAVSFCLGHCMS